MKADARTGRSKTLATWLALVGGSLGLHRFYLYGARDWFGWLHPLPTLLGAWGFWRLRYISLDDGLGTLLVPLLGLMLAATMLVAILYGLTSDEQWRARHGEAPGERPSGVAAIVGVCLALGFGAAVAMGTLAFVVERFYDWQIAV